MTPIISPLKSDDHGQVVANLEGAFPALLERTAILPKAPRFRQELLTLLQYERSRSAYGDITGIL